jgi:methyl-accepting chemotaxis protein
VGKRGDTSYRVSIAADESAKGGWAESTQSINNLVSDFVHPLTEVIDVIEAVAKGDLSKKIDVEGHIKVNQRGNSSQPAESPQRTACLRLKQRTEPPQGDFLRICKVVNSMVDQLNSFASEVSRVAREVGTEGKLGGQAQVPEVDGVWKDLTNNVNTMAANLTGQVHSLIFVSFPFEVHNEKCQLHPHNVTNTGPSHCRGNNSSSNR